MRALGYSGGTIAGARQTAEAKKKRRRKADAIFKTGSCKEGSARRWQKVALATDDLADAHNAQFSSTGSRFSMLFGIDRIRTQLTSRHAPNA